MSCHVALIDPLCANLDPDDDGSVGASTLHVAHGIGRLRQRKGLVDDRHDRSVGEERLPGTSKTMS